MLEKSSWNVIFSDIVAGLKHWRIWTALSWQEFRSTYRRSILGIMWVLASFAGFVFVKLIVFSSLLETSDGVYYNAFVTIGIYLWMYLVAVVNGAPSTFTSSEGWIRSEPLPYSLYVFKSIMRELYNFGLTFLVVIIAFIYIGFSVGPMSFAAIFAVIFYILNAIWIKFLLGTIGARFRDIGHFVNAITLPMMFLTPIFWMPEQMPDLMKVLWWNPFYHYLEIFRAPIVDGIIPVTSWIFVGVIFAVGWMITLGIFSRFKHRIVFWF